MILYDGDFDRDHPTPVSKVVWVLKDHFGDDFVNAYYEAPAQDILDALGIYNESAPEGK